MSASGKLPIDTATWLTTYAESEEVLRTPAFLQAGKTESASLIGGTVLTLDGEMHTASRRRLSRLVGRPALMRYESEILSPTISRALTRLESRRGADGVVRADLVDTVRRIFLQIAAEIIGLGRLSSEDDERELLRELYLFIDGSTVEWSRRSHSEVLAEANAAREAFDTRFFSVAWAKKLQQVKDVHDGKASETGLSADLLTIFALHALGNEVAVREGAIREAILFLVASTLNNAGLVTNMLDELEVWNRDHPDKCLDLADKKVFQSVVDETLRLHPPAPAIVRMASEQITIASGQSFNTGDIVALDLMKANQDPEAYGADANRFNPMRTIPNRARPYGLAFGAGSHVCLGQPLVTMARGGDGSEGSVGAQFKVMTALLNAGVRRDPSHPPITAASSQDRYDNYPVIFERL